MYRIKATQPALHTYCAATLATSSLVFSIHTKCETTVVRLHALAMPTSRKNMAPTCSPSPSQPRRHHPHTWCPCPTTPQDEDCLPMTFGLPLQPPGLPTDAATIASMVDAAVGQVSAHKGTGAVFDQEQARAIAARLRFRKTLLQVWLTCVGLLGTQLYYGGNYNNNRSSSRCVVCMYARHYTHTGAACRLFAGCPSQPGDHQEAAQRCRHAAQRRARLVCRPGR